MISEDCLLYKTHSVCDVVAQDILVRCKAADICDSTCPKTFFAKTTSDIFRSDERYWDKDYHDKKNLDAACSFIMVLKPKSCKK